MNRNLFWLETSLNNIVTRKLARETARQPHLDFLEAAQQKRVGNHTSNDIASYRSSIPQLKNKVSSMLGSHVAMQSFVLPFMLSHSPSSAFVIP
jgi:hypothetical protein